MLLYMIVIITPHSCVAGGWDVVGAGGVAGSRGVAGGRGITGLPEIANNMGG